MTTDAVMIHVRFANNGSVVEISDRPATLSPQQWFDALSDGAPPDIYQALAGGRGIFRLTKDQIEAVRTRLVSAAA